MTDKRVNMFEKAHEDRRQRFVEENDHVAKEIVISPDDDNNSDCDVDDVGTDINNSSGNFLLKEVHQKVPMTVRVDKNINTFIDGLHKTTGAKKVEIVNEFLIYAIMNQDDLTELRNQNKKVQSLFEKFINS